MIIIRNWILFLVIFKPVVHSYSHGNRRDENVSDSENTRDVTLDSIFEMGTENYPVIFTTTPNTQRKRQMETLESIDKDIFIQRNPEGKLDYVVRDSTTRRKPAPDIIFPTDKPNRRSQPECEAGSVCTKVHNYPARQIERLLKQHEILKFDAFFGDDNVVVPNITQRIDPDEESLCRSVEKLIYPKTGKTKDDQWLFIINHQNYTQGIRVEECSNPGQRCEMSDNFPNGYITECKQKYIFRQLVAYNNHTNQIVKDHFQLPSCCQCILRQRNF